VARTILIPAPTAGVHMAYRFRPAAPRDRETVFAFCANTWPNGDYIPMVWDAWLAEAPLGGAFVVGVDADGTPLALGKLSLASPTEGWIEGIRVDPARRLHGWGRALMLHLLDQGWAQGLGTVSYLTAGDNTPMHHLSGSIGFAARAQYHPYRAPAGGDAPIRQAAPAEAAALWEHLIPDNSLGPPVWWRGWTGAAATPAWWHGAVADGRVLIATDGRAAAVLTPPDPAPDDEAPDAPRPARVREHAQIALFAGDPAAAPALLAAARAWAATAHAAEVFALLPPLVVPAAAADGWLTRTDHPFSLYHRARPAALDASAGDHIDASANAVASPGQRAEN
jgi:GNAT superfamily N-acetyltransferase